MSRLQLAKQIVERAAHQGAKVEAPENLKEGTYEGVGD